MPLWRYRDVIQRPPALHAVREDCCKLVGELVGHQLLTALLPRKHAYYIGCVPPGSYASSAGSDGMCRSHGQ